MFLIYLKMQLETAMELSQFMYPTRNIHIHYENTHDFFMTSKDFINFHNFLSVLEISFKIP